MKSEFQIKEEEKHGFVARHVILKAIELRERCKCDRCQKQKIYWEKRLNEKED